jgi:DNA-binding SARP family transcriptional activator
LLARHGDPMLADERLLVVHRQGIYPKELWRVTLLRAYAAWRRGDPAAGTLAARAFEEAARLGQPQAPMIKERALSESLLALAVETGSHAATALEAESLPLTLALLGRFELTEGGRAVPIGPGQALQLLKMVASCGGRVLVDRAIDALWPDADAATGRNRLRTVLGRLRETAREALVRDGDLLALGAGVRLDLAEFHREAREARALFAGDPGAAVAVARSAVARYRGELLPDDLYEAWAEEPREAARRAMLDVLDLCATEAARQGNLDEARRMVERSLELAPYEDDRYLRVAEILQEQGRRGAALSVLRRAKAVLAPLGIEVPVVLPRSSKTTAA